MNRVVRWLRFVRDRGLYPPRYWLLALKYLWFFKVRNRHIVTRGFVFLEPGSEVYCRRGLARMELGRWVHVGRRTAIRCHEGFLRVGDSVVFGSDDTVNCYLDVEIGDDCILADRVYIGDFDHRFANPSVPIRKQGIATAPVRVEDDCWIGEKASIVRGVTVGRGAVIGASSVVTHDLPPYSVAAGNPARVIRRRG
jgi:acetyltransferase-like isoleucine patch superfamily enzyme